VAAGVLAVLLAAFFRDPERQVPAEGDLLVSPADGKVTDVLEMTEEDFFHGPVKRIGIFLSVFDVHLNRAPCEGEVAYVKERPGKCLNALRHGDASAQNQATSLGIFCPNSKAGKIMVRQITGAIARRIVCDCVIGTKLARGQRYGMIKFGSRTELYWPAANGGQVMVKAGDTVRAGQTILVKF
jgi:phosphatidylserine decarboxylase